MLSILRVVGGLEQEAMPVGVGFFAVRSDDTLWIVITRVLRALSDDASIAESLRVGVVGQNLQPVGHLALEFYNAGIVVTVQASPLQVNIAEPAGVIWPGQVVDITRSPSSLIRRSVDVIEIPTICPFRPDVRQGDHRIAGDLLLDIKQVAVDVGRAKRFLVGVHDRLISAVSVIALPRAGRDGEGSRSHLRRHRKGLREAGGLRGGVVDFITDEAAGHAPVKRSGEDIRYLTRARVVVKAVSRADDKLGAKLHRQAEPGSEVVLGSRGIVLRKAGGDSGYGESIRGRLVNGTTNTVCGEDRNGQFVAESVGERQPLSDLQLVVEVCPVVRDDRIRFRGRSEEHTS